ncbi:multifunctional methyltransferase subunit TRM112-like protein [Heracleum sosnowskyi]|uniref:Multifunctional methyltransferase subunit TRM112-like protein n=1 Tax=Heracleum sosnowskyi TaxID=360622 RepID=A0AAD8JL94_9APIA|nr:multifunctional methyltransferase subunit TRM112-like protein [Heracleum sosnowskyi]
MKLLTHNMLSSNIKGVTNGFPLGIEAEKVIERSVDMNPDFLKNMFSKIEWKPLVEASRIMGYSDLPEDVPDSSVLDSEEFLRKFHHALLEIHLEEGALVCPQTGRKFPVNKGIPNMLLHEDEV